MTIREKRENEIRFKKQVKEVVESVREKNVSIETFIKNKGIIIEYADLMSMVAGAGFKDEDKSTIYIDDKLKEYDYMLLVEYYKLINELYYQTPLEDVSGPFQRDYIHFSNIYAYKVLIELDRRDDIPAELCQALEGWDN